MMNNKNNICCRVFKEQMELVNQLPPNERAQVLYCAIMNSFNQFDYQNENQNENQNDYAYVSESVSVSDLGKCIINLLSKKDSYLMTGCQMNRQSLNLNKRVLIGKKQQKSLFLVASQRD